MKTNHVVPALMAVVALLLIAANLAAAVPSYINEARVSLTVAEVLADGRYAAFVRQFGLDTAVLCADRAEVCNLPAGARGKFRWGTRTEDAFEWGNVTPEESSVLPGVIFNVGCDPYGGRLFLHAQKGCDGNAMMFYGVLPASPRDGEAGPCGPQGPPGAGMQGPPGEPGAQGPQGFPGVTRILEERREIHENHYFFDFRPCDRGGPQVTSYQTPGVSYHGAQSLWGGGLSYSEGSRINVQGGAGGSATSCSMARGGSAWQLQGQAQTTVVDQTQNTGISINNENANANSNSNAMAQSQ